MKRHPGAAEMGPLGHGFEVIDRLGRFHFDRSGQLASFVGGRKHQVREYLNGPDLDWHGLIVADVGCYVMPLLQLGL